MLETELQPSNLFPEVIAILLLFNALYAKPIPDSTDGKIAFSLYKQAGDKITMTDLVPVCASIRKVLFELRLQRSLIQGPCCRRKAFLEATMSVHGVRAQQSIQVGL